MMTHESDRDREGKIKYAVLAVTILEVLRSTGYLGSNEDEEKEEEVLRAAHTLVQVQDVNTHPLLAQFDSDCSSSGEVGLARIGSAINAGIGSTINHSCDPNTCRINVGRQTLLFASRNVPPGTEITDIYSMHHSEIPRGQRRAWLKDNFYFECRCRACKRDYPVYSELPSNIEPGVVDKLKVGKSHQYQ